MVSRFTGYVIQPNKAIVGANAFAHESGIHIAALLENDRTYELYSPELVGGHREFILGKHSGGKPRTGARIGLDHEWSPWALGVRGRMR